MSSSSKTRSKENKANELEPEDTSELEESIKYLEPKTEGKTKSENLQETGDYSQIYGPKNTTKKALTAMSCASLAAGSATAATMGIGGALILDFYGDDETYSVEKAEQIYRRVENYIENIDF